MDEKMLLFSKKEFWERALEKGINKGINKALLNTVSTPEGRIVICEAIMEGRYKVEPPVVREVPKTNGKIREVYSNNQMDRVVLGVINEVYYEMFIDKIHPNCLSYRKGMGVPKIIHSIIGELSKGYSGYKVDLTKYFDSVNKETLYKALDELDTGSPLDKVVQEYYKDDRIILNGKEVERYKSLAQGCALGAFLANYVLRHIDEELSAMDILYYRYSDDILILGNEADKALSLLKDRLHDLGLELNPKKIELINAGEEFTFLGAKVHGTEVDLAQERVEQYKRNIRKITKVKSKKQRSRAGQKKAIEQINQWLYLAYIDSPKNFGWMEYFGNLITTDKTLRMLDEFTKDHLKHMYTGKWNHTTNQNKTSNEQLKEMGYHSLPNMYYLFTKVCHEVYEQELR